MFNGAGAPIATDQWIQQHYPFGGYGQPPADNGMGGTIVKYLLAIAVGWIAHDYYEKQQRGGPR